MFIFSNYYEKIEVCVIIKRKDEIIETMRIIAEYCMDELGLDETVVDYFTPSVASGRIQLKTGLKPYRPIKDIIVLYETGKPCDELSAK